MPDISDFCVRRMSSDDVELVLIWRNHENVRRWMVNQSEVSLEEHRNWFALNQNNDSRELFIVDNGSIPVGFVQFDLDKQHKRAEWGFYRAPEVPKGIGKSLGAVALNVAFYDLGLNKVCGKVLHINKISTNFHASLGFRKEGVLRKHALIGDKFFDMEYFGLLESEWHAHSACIKGKN